ncbi:MAG: hypothetical protein C4554_03535 [Dethiobacter sp.]|nr:MAG: hypothetical protein C4554_03535 [Dethiobacter sp.]
MSDILTREELDRLLKEGKNAASRESSLGDPEQRQKSTDTNKRKLELILDVPVRSRVVVGKTTKKLRDLLALKPGMIIETENYVTEYVELYVNDNVIALGEVVVVGENYGLRVKQIITPAERIRKLK